MIDILSDIFDTIWQRAPLYFRTDYSICDLVKSIVSNREFAIEQLEHYIRGIGT